MNFIPKSKEKNSWSYYGSDCQLCKKNTVKHYAKGYCKPCYDKLYTDWLKQKRREKKRDRKSKI